MIEFHNLSDFTLSIGPTSIERQRGARIPAADFWAFCDSSDGRHLVKGHKLRLTGESRRDYARKLDDLRKSYMADAGKGDEGKAPEQCPPDKVPTHDQIAACLDVDLLLAWMDLDETSDGKRTRMGKRVAELDPELADLALDGDEGGE